MREYINTSILIYFYSRFFMNPFVIAFRRIIYAIPLKVLLLLLAVFGVLFVSFSSADKILPTSSWEGNYYLSDGAFRYSRELISFTLTSQTVTVSDEYDFFCFRSNSNSASDYSSYSFDNSIWVGSPGNQFFCTNEHTIYFKCQQYNSCQVNFFYFKEGDGFIPNQFDSLQCQTEYNLIPIDSVDQDYCEDNNLCPTYNCPANPIGTGTLSNLYINNILHIGAPNIIMNIPEEIDWDYAYTQGGQNMNIDIVGYNQDFEKIEGWIETNNYKPSSDDFTNIFTSGFSNFGGLLVATLFVILVFYFVKKMFK